MAASRGQVPATGSAKLLPDTPNAHQKNKPSALRSLIMHRRTGSDGEALPPAALLPVTLGAPGEPREGPRPLEEMSHNRQLDLSAQAEKRGILGNNNNNSHKAVDVTSPTKKKKIAREAPSPVKPSNRTNLADSSSKTTADPGSPTKKSRPLSTSFVGLLSRPKSLRSPRKVGDKEADAAEILKEEERERKRKDKHRLAKDKENRTPPSSVAHEAKPVAQVTPIYAQFCTTDAQGSGSSRGGESSTSEDRGRSQAAVDLPTERRHNLSKPRPKSFHPGSSNNNDISSSASRTPAHTDEPSIDPKDIDTHLEALLDRRNIPEHQRYKMRNLANTIKMEFIRQDWAEARAKQQQQSDRPNSHDSARSTNGMTGSATPASTEAADESGKVSKSMHARVKSLTFSRVARGRSRDRGSNGSGSGSGSNSTGRKKGSSSPVKKKSEGTLGRHLRSKSTESFMSSGGCGESSDTQTSAGAASTGSSGIASFFSKAKAPQQHTPGDFVTYLQTVQQPELVEVGKLHKLRLLLRNETVAWTEDFIGQGGMEETVGLLHRILAIEWREEHEDALLHENLLCLKALCTTELALQYLHKIHASLLPALIHMIFDPEKKGPSEFTTRNIVTSILFTYIQSASPDEKPERAKTVLGYLRDPEGSEDERPVSFVLEMHRERPYRAWCKEVVSVTKEVFWIFLHHLNVVSLPAAAKAKKTANSEATTPVLDASFSSTLDGAPSTPSHPPPPPHGGASSYMLRHFPQERPPVPAAPYVGGVEWEATNYLASHLDLANAILACTPTAAERNSLRGLMQMSGWERCMGGSLRLCKEKFYGAVHDGLRTWTAAAWEDGWDVRDVRYGPAPAPAAPSAERQSSPKRKTPAAGGPLADELAPKLEIPKLDFVLDGDGL